MSRYVRIALFIIITGVASTWYVMQLSEELGGGETYTVHAFIDDASGLVLDSNVTLAGVNVGRLKEIELEGGQAKLTLEVQKGVELYQDAVVAKETQSVLGTSMVTLNPGTGKGAQLSDGGVIENVRRQATISDAVDSADQLVSGMSQFIDEVNSFFGDEGTVARMNEIITVVQQTATMTNDLLRQNLEIARASMENLQSASSQINSAMGQVNSTTARINKVTTDQIENLAMTLEGAATLASRLNELAATGDARLRSTFDQADGTFEEFQSTIRETEMLVRELRMSANTITNDIGEFTGRLASDEGTLGKLLTDDQLYDRAVTVTKDAETFMSSARNFAQSAERVAQSADEILQATTALDVQVDFRTEVLANRIAAGQEGWSKDYFSLRLIPGESDKFYSLGVVTSPYTLSETVTTIEDKESDGDPATTTETTTQRKDLRLSAQLARVWGPITLRAGVFENFAGLALDYQPIPQLSVSAEAFDFGGNGGPYLRTYGTVYPFFDPDSDNPLRWLYLSGGVDDILGQQQVDGFVSIGARLADKDLRNFVGLIPLTQ